jgi:polyketide cyclase/dehydrase/lipid transport protein
MATETKGREQSGTVKRLRGEAGGLFEALAQRATSSMRERIEGTTGRLTDYAEGDGGPGLMAAVTGARNLAEGKSPLRSALGAGFAGVKEKVAGIFGGGKGKGGGKRKLKLTNIVESIDVGVPVRLAYNQWTQYADFPTFTKKVESVDTPEDGKTNWKAQVFWSHRTWEATIQKQIPDECIVWRSKAPKGHVDGAVTFHELGPNLTRILLVLEYHPQGLFERTGNLWRAQGRRARLELKHYRRHVMTHSLLDPDEVEGWRGTIEDGEVVKDHETALQEEGREPGEGEEQEQELEDLTDEERADRERAGEEEGADYETRDEESEGEEPEDEEPEDEEFTDEEPAAEAEEFADEDRADAGNGRSALGRRSAAGGAGNGRRPAAARSGRTEERPQRARRGATRGGAR